VFTMARDENMKEELDRMKKETLAQAQYSIDG
jgi:hypothetical protein